MLVWAIMGMVSLVGVIVTILFTGLVDGLGIALVGAALTVFLCGLGSILALGSVGEGAAAVATEKPEAFGKLLLLQVLPGTQGIYGFIIGFIVLLKLGILGGELQELTVQQGWNYFVACLPMMLSGLLSALYQGRVSSAGLKMVAKDPASGGKAMIMSAMVETYAVLGLLVTFLATFFLIK